MATKKGRENERKVEKRENGALILFTAKNRPRQCIQNGLCSLTKLSEIPYNPNISDYNKGRKEKNQKLLQKEQKREMQENRGCMKEQCAGGRNSARRNVFPAWSNFLHILLFFPSDI